MQTVNQYYRALKRGASVPEMALPDQIFSFRLVNPSYLGNCVEVRRSGDNATQNIGFSGGVLDSSALSTFVGANNGFVKTWYNQNGAINLIQTVNADQPQIVSSGTLKTFNSKPTLEFNSSSQFLYESTASSLFLGDKIFTNPCNVAQIHYAFESAKTAQQMWIATDSGSTFGQLSQQGSTTTATQSNWANSTYADPDDNYYCLINNIESHPFTNRGEVYTKTTGQKVISESNVGFASPRIARIGRYSNTSFSFVGKIPEILIYNQTTFEAFRDRATIPLVQSFINSYYSIY
jgi:hypothetical protein